MTLPEVADGMANHALSKNFRSAVMILSLPTDMPGQTAQTQIRVV